MLYKTSFPDFCYDPTRKEYLMINSPETTAIAIPSCSVLRVPFALTGWGKCKCQIQVIKSSSQVITCHHKHTFQGTSLLLNNLEENINNKNKERMIYFSWRQSRKWYVQPNSRPCKSKVRISMIYWWKKSCQTLRNPWNIMCPARSIFTNISGHSPHTW